LHPVKYEMKKPKKTIEASKKIVIFCDLLLTAVIIATFAAAFNGYDVSSLVTLDMGIIGLVTTAHGFYYDKARRENTLKIAKAYEIDSELIADMVKGSLEVSNMNGGY